MRVKRQAAAGETPIRAGSVQAWLAAVRPRTLLVAFSPVLVGAAFGFARTGSLDWVAAWLALACAVLMQVVTNLQNDVGYTVRGGERHAGRSGLPRATARGWLTVATVRTGIAALAVLATGLGLALAAWRGWPVLAIGVSSLLAALAYMGGPRPIAYTPAGELTVFVFFGLVAVMGTDWLLTGNVGTATVIAAAAIGSLAAAVLAVNNHRDIAHDRLVGRNTFAVCYGDLASRRLYAGLLLAPFALLLPLAWLAGPLMLAPLLLWPLAWQLRRDFDRCPPGPAFNEVLARTLKMEAWFACVLAAAALLGRAVP